MDTFLGAAVAVIEPESEGMRRRDGACLSGSTASVPVWENGSGASSLSEEEIGERVVFAVLDAGEFHVATGS